MLSKIGFIFYLICEAIHWGGLLFMIVNIFYMMTTGTSLV